MKACICPFEESGVDAVLSCYLPSREALYECQATLHCHYACLFSDFGRCCRCKARHFELVI
jgi:hypothetical protein